MIRTLLIRIHWLLSYQFGIDILKLFRSIVGLPHYFRDMLHFRKLFSGKLELMPCLHDWKEEGGATKNEYFWQDLLVARKIYSTNPRKHVDIGSRVDGFVAHVASFREIEVFDIRPITTSIPGITFKQADLMNSETEMVEYCDSLSCLHALEHFGLGRYGDPITSKGYELGVTNMSRILKSGGVFYLSVPVGIERVEFNAQYVFDPSTIIKLAKINNLKLKDFQLFTAEHGLSESNSMHDALIDAKELRNGLGIFTFIKN